jgi:hypothetical protein
MSYALDKFDNKGREGLRVANLCYRYLTYRKQVQQGVILSANDEQRLATLEHLLVGDPQYHRRRHRRISTLLRANLRSSSGQFPATVLNLSASGMFLISDAPVSMGSPLLVDVLHKEEPCYRFFCVVRHRDRQATPSSFGVTFFGDPHGEPAAMTIDSTEA